MRFNRTISANNLIFFNLNIEKYIPNKKIENYFKSTNISLFFLFERIRVKLRHVLELNNSDEKYLSLDDFDFFFSIMIKKEMIQKAHREKTYKKL